MAVRRTASRGRILAMWAAGALVVASCSVTKPRHGFTTGLHYAPI